MVKLTNIWYFSKMPQMPILPNQTTIYQRSINDFRSARQQAAMESVVGRLTGKSTELLSFDDVAKKLKVLSHSERGIRDIPVAAIVGSVGRYTDFSRSFLPKQESDAERWARVASVPDYYQLPPIDVYQIGDVYFVLDGNHRVSIARQRGIETIPAAIVEVRTRAPIPANVSSDKMILQAEYVQFLENTQLDELRPKSDVQVSIPGQYGKLEDHIAVHRFFIEADEENKLTDAETVTRWYDEAYLPVVEAVREQGILRDFPNRTEADLYLWISEHQSQLRDELGWQVRPEVAAANLAGRFKSETGSKLVQMSKKLGRSVLNVVIPKGGSRSQSWSELKKVARYSDRLFADLLVVLSDNQDNQTVLDQALVIAQREESRIFGLCPMPSSNQQSGTPARSAEIKLWFEKKCAAADVEGHMARESGDPVETICDRAILADLVLCNRLSFGNVPETGAGERLISLVRKSPRPVFITTDKVIPIESVFLAYDGCSKSKEALFVAAYMAERWNVTLTVGLAPEGRYDEDKVIGYARNYLEMHEVEADYVVCEIDPISLVIDTARDNGAQLIIAGGYSERRFGRQGPGNIVNRLVNEWPGALLICP